MLQGDNFDEIGGQGRIQGEGYKGQPPPPPFWKIILRMCETHCQIEAWIAKQGDEERQSSSCMQCLLSTQEAVSGCGGFFLEPEAVFHGHQVRWLSQAQP